MIKIYIERDDNNVLKKIVLHGHATNCTHNKNNEVCYTVSVVTDVIAILSGEVTKNTHGLFEVNVTDENRFMCEFLIAAIDIIRFNNPLAFKNVKEELEIYEH